MGPGSKALLCGMVLGGIYIAGSQALPKGGSKLPEAATLERADLYLDRSSAQLARVVAAIRNETAAAEVDEELKQYTREFSQFHVTMAELRIGKQEFGFAGRAVSELESQVSRLEAVRQNLQPGRAGAFGEAVSHLKSALQMIAQKLDSKSRSRLFKVSGAGPAPGAKPAR